MAELNQELSQLARDIIKEMREEGWGEDEVFWSTCGGLLKHCEAHELIEDTTTKYDIAVIKVLVRTVMQEKNTVAQDEPILSQCPYCLQMHEIQFINQCPLKPKHGYVE